MKVIPTAIPEVLVLEPRVYADERGYFFESFNQIVFNEAIGKEINFVQDNHSKSIKNVLRGLHYQGAPKAQGKLVRVVEGEVFDVVIDIREKSKTCGQWLGEMLSAENNRQIWIPEGFAHGFLTMSETAVLLYKVTEYYEPKHECCIAWDDPTIGIKWPISGKPLLSSKDAKGKSWLERKLFL